MGIFERIKTAIGGGLPVAQPKPSAGYMRENRGSLFSGWNAPVQRSENVVANGWDQAAGRALDLVQNSGMISGMIDQVKTELIGPQLTLSLVPDYKFLKMTEEKAMDWAMEVESRFSAYGSNPREFDAEGRLNFGAYQAAQVGAWIALGEMFASLPYEKRVGCVYGTKVKAIPAYMALNTSNSDDVVQGVKIDRLGAAKGYYFRQKSAEKYSFERDVYIPARDNWGRAQVIHNFLPQMIGQVRGISILAPALQVARQWDQLQNATLTAATLQTIYAATIESEMPSIEVIKALQTPQDAAMEGATESWLNYSMGWNKNTDIRFNQPYGHDVGIAHLMPNEKLNINRSEHPNSTYVDFAKWLLHEIARCLGLQYEAATGDYADSSYASLQVGNAKGYQTMTAKRLHLMAPHCDEIFDSWMEEDIELGNTQFPGGVDGWLMNKNRGVRKHWRGPGKAQGDDLKSARAYQVLDDIGVITGEAICEEMGRDYDDVLRRRAIEMRRREKYGLPEPVNSRKVDGPTNDQLINEAA